MRRALTVPLTNCVVFLCSTLLEVIDSVWIRHGCTVLLPKNGLVFYLQRALCAAGGSWHSSPSRYSMVTAGQGIGGGCFVPGLAALPRSFLLDLRADGAAGFHGLSLSDLMCD